MKLEPLKLINTRVTKIYITLFYWSNNNVIYLLCNSDGLPLSVDNSAVGRLLIGANDRSHNSRRQSCTNERQQLTAALRSVVVSPSNNRAAHCRKTAFYQPHNLHNQCSVAQYGLVLHGTQQYCADSTVQNCAQCECLLREIHRHVNKQFTNHSLATEREIAGK